MTESGKPWDGVSDEAIASLRQTRLDLGDGVTKSAADLVLGWAQHVVRLKGEASGDAVRIVARRTSCSDRSPRTARAAPTRAG
jgi:hypothetical protein